MTQFYPRELMSIFVTSYYSQGDSGGILNPASPTHRGIYESFIQKLYTNVLTTTKETYYNTSTKMGCLLSIEDK
jgi:hypothetical protein